MPEIIKKAVFPVAGFGTRFLPATKAMPKELLPIVDKPLIQYAVEEAVDAGIDTLIFITGRNKRAIEDHFDSNLELERALRSVNKNEKADMVRNILPKGVECIFVRQPEQLGLGNAVLCAERAIGHEPFAVILADDFLVKKRIGATKNLLAAYSKTGLCQVSVMSIHDKSLSEYGVIIGANTNKRIDGIVEKPLFEEAPSNLAVVGRYVFNSKIFSALKEIKPDKNNELQLTDAINIIARDFGVEAVPLTGKRFDCGSIKGFVDAVKYVSKIRGI